MRWLATILYPVIVLAGFWIIVERRPAPDGLVALRGIEAGELMRDIAPGSGAFYARRKISAGETIKTSDFVTFPPMAAPDGALVIALTVERALVDSGDLNGGKPARLCPGAATDTVPVQAVLCGPPNGPCVAFAAIPAAKLAPLGEALKAPNAKAKLVRANAPMC